jgi:hypothetical protein
MAEAGKTPESRSPLRRSWGPSARVLGLVVVAAMFAVAVALIAPGTTSGSAKPVYRGIWLSSAEIGALPRRGSAWRRLKAVADGSLGRADISNQNSTHDVKTLAAALVYVRTGKGSYRRKAVEGIEDAIGTESGGRTLALGRNLVSYVIAADLVNLPAYDRSVDNRFRSWLRSVRTKSLSGFTLISTHERRPNNWGTHAGASRAAIAAYLGEKAELGRIAQVFRGWLGDRSAYSAFKYDELDWQADEDNPVPVNPAGATKEGESIDGALPAEMRRGGSFRFPPKRTGYPWGALAGAVVQAELLSRQGYDTWSWSDQALRRATQFLSDLHDQYGKWWAIDDDTWIPWLVNARYDTRFETDPAGTPGKNMGWTDWTHAR